MVYWHMLFIVDKTLESKMFSSCHVTIQTHSDRAATKQTTKKNAQKKAKRHKRDRMQNVTNIKADDLLARDRHKLEPKHNSRTFSSAFRRPCL